jgi:hypothetical protein
MPSSSPSRYSNRRALASSQEIIATAPSSGAPSSLPDEALPPDEAAPPDEVLPPDPPFCPVRAKKRLNDSKNDT